MDISLVLINEYYYFKGELVMSRVNLGVKPYTTPQPVWILAAYDENGVAFCCLTV